MLLLPEEVGEGVVVGLLLDALEQLAKLNVEDPDPLLDQVLLLSNHLKVTGLQFLEAGEHPAKGLVALGGPEFFSACLPALLQVLTTKVLLFLLLLLLFILVLFINERIPVIHQLFTHYSRMGKRS